ncbi:MAG TPA: adenylate/guanylate cyclase domain-containing protein [Anaerolineae bacterium]|nr:adenylate/guanylate cyclase domain-containing protein [Anaerolineae bacterium]
MGDLKQQLQLKQRELEIVLAIDGVRDSAQGPMAMLSGIVNIVAEQFKSDLCLLYLIDPETKLLELKVVNEHNKGWLQLHSALLEDVAEKALTLDALTIWPAQEVLPPEVLSHVPATLQLALIPIFMECQNLPLGLLLLTRASAPFSDDDMALLEIAESQIDSAVIQAYTYHELEQRNKELETIYQFDRIRDQHLPFDEMLDVVLQELCKVIQAEMGFVMLYNPKGERLEMRAITHEDLLRDTRYYRLINQLANEAMESGELVCNQNETRARCAVMCIPLILQDEIIGVFGALHRDPQRAFTSDDRRLLRAIVSQMDTAILESMEKRNLRRVLGRSLDPHIMEALLAHPEEAILKGERETLTVLYADLRGSTALAERTDPETLVEFINAYLSEMTDVVLSFEGTLDKFVGDEVMALFNAPLPQPDHALRAVRVGLAMQERYAQLLARWQAERGVGAEGIGVGMATGEAIVGEIGCEKRTDYTVIGRPANLGARICAVAKTGQVLVSEATYELVKDKVDATPVPGMQFKGIGQPVTVYLINRVLEDA